MTALTPSLWWVVAALALLAPGSQCKELTHEDIRDAMLSIVRMMRLTEEKLERHEYREKGLGDYLKKIVTSTDRKVRELDPLKGMISRLDERLSNVETILLHNDDRDRTNQKKTLEAIDNLNKSLQKLTTAVETLKAEKSNDTDKNLTTNDNVIEKRLDVTDSKISEVKSQIDGLKNNLNVEALRSVCREVATDMNPFEKHITDAEKLLNKYELKLNEYNETKVPTDIVPLSDVAMADEACHSKMSDEIERQGKEVVKIQKLLSDAEGVWKQLPKLSDLNTATNVTLAALAHATDKNADSMDKSVTKVDTKIRELGDRLLATNEDIQRSLTEGNTLTERAYNKVAAGYDGLKDGVEKLSKYDQVLNKTAEEVLTNRRRVEFAVHQILNQVTELVLTHGTNLNDTLTDRLNAIEAAIMGNQLLSQLNLSAKVEAEVSPVWRQIGILHAQLRQAQDTLTTLAERSEQYANSSTVTMGKVKADVSTITSEVRKLNDDFNFALGELGVATQEFRRIAASMHPPSTAAPTYKVMAHTAAERAKRYREKLKQNPEKFEEQWKKHLKQLKKSRKNINAGPGPHNFTSTESV